MTQHWKRLQRLLAIRRIGEEVERRNLRSAVASLAEVETALGQQQQAMVEACDAASSALHNADRREWLFAEAQAEVAGWNQMRLAPVLKFRRAAIAPATSAFLGRCRDAEQMKRLVQHRKLEAQVVEDRRAQATADDWFVERLLAKRK